jgi:hypothetical protein
MTFRKNVDCDDLIECLDQFAFDLGLDERGEGKFRGVGNGFVSESTVMDHGKRA